MQGDRAAICNFIIDKELSSILNDSKQFLFWSYSCISFSSYLLFFLVFINIDCTIYSWEEYSGMFLLRDLLDNTNHFFLH